MSWQSPCLRLAGRASLPLAHGCADLPNLVRRFGACVGRIFKGEKAADLPVEQATKFELVINLKTAQALGVKIPESIQLRAQVIK
jgi:putative ABC transport system substrate-binding protein